MKKSILILCLIISSCNLFGFTSKINGIILDKTTKAPIAYAHLVILNTKFATTSNNKGEFILNTFNKKKHTIRISCIGYKTLEIKVNELQKVIYLESYTYILDEIIVGSNKPSAHNYIAKAFSKIKDNYIVRNHLLTGYFKEGEYENNDPIYTAESTVEAKLPTINDLYTRIPTRYFDKREKVYKKLSKYKLKVKKGGARRSIKYSMIDPINAMNPLYFDKYDYEIKGFENYNDRQVVVISFGNDARLAVYGLFFIDLETYAFIRLEGNQLHGDGGIFDNWKWKHHKWIEEYKQNDKGLYYLEGALYKGNWIKKRSKTEYEFKSVFVTDTIENDKEFSKGGITITHKQSFFKSIAKSKENLFKNMDLENIKIIENKLNIGFPKYSSIKRPYRK